MRYALIGAAVISAVAVGLVIIWNGWGWAHEVLLDADDYDPHEDFGPPAKEDVNIPPSFDFGPPRRIPPGVVGQWRFHE